ncbi:hypothetical protein SAMN04488025_13513 [Planifilum fulgidum]|uniref:Uncharacterized protein n=1 Tax=Planifilum fulgidum TaxID=201973 RepID=A0A1I2RZF3_9BACL|nr:hypothetical protein SAMN04488025_13513 [Planifilum fulgidum]
MGEIEVSDVKRRIRMFQDDHGWVFLGDGFPIAAKREEGDRRISKSQACFLEKRLHF